MRLTTPRLVLSTCVALCLPLLGASTYAQSTKLPTPQAAPVSADPAATLAWIRSSAIPLATVTPGPPWDDSNRSPE